MSRERNTAEEERDKTEKLERNQGGEGRIESGLRKVLEGGDI